MPVPESVQRTLDDMGQEFRRGGYVPYHENHEFILSAARDDPNSVLTVAHQLCVDSLVKTRFEEVPAI